MSAVAIEMHQPYARQPNGNGEPPRKDFMRLSAPSFQGCRPQNKAPTATINPATVDTKARINCQVSPVGIMDGHGWLQTVPIAAPPPRRSATADVGARTSA